MYYTYAATGHISSVQRLAATRLEDAVDESNFRDAEPKQNRGPQQACDSRGLRGLHTCGAHAAALSEH